MNTRHQVGLLGNSSLLAIAAIAYRQSSSGLEGELAEVWTRDPFVPWCPALVPFSAEDFLPQPKQAHSLVCLLASKHCKEIDRFGPSSRLPSPALCPIDPRSFRLPHPLVPPKMRRQTSVASLLYTHLFPSPGPSDPPNFQTHLARNLIPEIRIETATFYGSLDSIEARYPGLNYCHGPHRMRLGRFPHHARLFAVIDELGVTDQEVMDLVRWEGTLWARQRFERDEGVKVKDTTGDGIADWIDPRMRSKQKGSIRVQTEVEITEGRHPVDMLIDDDNDQDALDQDVENDDDDDEDDVGENIQSIGHELNRRLLAAIAARQQGLNVEMDPEFEAYLKELVESGNLLATSRPIDGPITAPIPRMNPTSAASASAAAAAAVLRQPATS